MAVLFAKLGVPKNVRLFFEPFYQLLPDGSLLFPFGEEAEHFSLSFHQVPSTVIPWNAGNGPHVFISHSAMECIAFLSCYSHAYPVFGQLQFIAIGNYFNGLQVSSSKVALLFGRDILGRLTDIKVSTSLRNRGAPIFYCGEELFDISGQTFNASELSLNAFETLLGVRSGIRTIKPRGFNTFLEQLKHQNL
ncbi:hypothetical protein [Mucilaginibacter sp. KACC 22063]|uniref:hypothetical protein n=1 Tax=Mucilaginibacter sp. KACC 22063 TaxID=3025666 RepID=UPI002366202F|nr:hypothetical protein [Mucilaginibacter sp. KACC 22063]WDF55900.1 hypothetical protein PQ461_02345 [Mucilaginibacter sp. KACC 22063]